MMKRKIHGSVQATLTISMSLRSIGMKEGTGRKENIKVIVEDAVAS